MIRAYRRAPTRRRQTVRGLLVLLCLAGSLACTAAELQPGHLQGLGKTDYFRLESPRLGHPLHVYVRQPSLTLEAGATAEPGTSPPPRRFPLVVLLDGGVMFPLLSAYHHLLRYGEELPEIVLVGLSYGSDRFADGNYRASDFTAPAADRAWWGKAPAFQAMLAEELLPRLEADYPADPARRILFGQSLAGQFVLYSALTRPTLFQGHLASNPALHRNLPFFLTWQGDGEMPSEATRLFVGSAEFDAPRFQEPAGRWRAHWRAASAAPFILEWRALGGHTHLSAATETFRQGLEWLLTTDPADHSPP